MIILNITIKVDWSIADKWMLWQQNIHLPEILGTGCFLKHQFVKLLEVNDAEGPTYALQLYASSMDRIRDYQQQYDNNFQQELREYWGNNYVDFRTLMELL